MKMGHLVFSLSLMEMIVMLLMVIVIVISISREEKLTEQFPCMEDY